MKAPSEDVAGRERLSAVLFQGQRLQVEPAAARIAIVFGVAGPLLRRLNQTDLATPTCLREDVERLVVWNSVLKLSIRRLSHGLARAGTRGVLLKGGALLASGAEWARTRYMEDIDLLVHPAGVESLERQLAREGWDVVHRLAPSGRRRRPGVGRWSARHEAASCTDPNGAHVDLHRRMFGEECWDERDFNHLWCRAVPVHGVHDALRRASAEDVLAQLCRHVVGDVLLTERLLPRHLVDLTELCGGEASVGAGAQDPLVRQSLVWLARVRHGSDPGRLGPRLFVVGTPWARARRLRLGIRGLASAGHSLVYEPSEAVRAVVPSRAYLEQVVDAPKGASYRELWLERVRGRFLERRRP